MSFYNWIQEKLFDEYEEWRLKSPGSNGNGFNIVGIDNMDFICTWSFTHLMPSMDVQP